MNLTEQLKSLKYTSPVNGVIDKLNATVNDTDVEDENEEEMNEEMIRKELMSDVDPLLSLEKKLAYYSKIVKSSFHIKGHIKDTELMRVCTGREYTAKHGCSIIQLLIPYLNFIIEYRQDSPLFISHYYKVLAQGWTASRFFCKDDIFTGLIMNLRDSLLPGLKSITSEIYQNPKENIKNINFNSDTFKAFKTEYLVNREEIERNGKIIRWEFDQTKLFDDTNYISDILADLKHILTMLTKIENSLDDDLKECTNEAISIDELLKKAFKVANGFEQIQFDIWDKKNKNTWKMMLRRFDDNIVHIEEMICQFITNCLRKSCTSFNKLKIIQCCTSSDTLDSVKLLSDENMKQLIFHFQVEITKAKESIDIVAKAPLSVPPNFQLVYELKKDYERYKRVMIELRNNKIIETLEGKVLFDSYIQFSIVVKTLHDQWTVKFFDNSLESFHKALNYNILKEDQNKITVNFPFHMYDLIKEISKFDSFVTDIPVDLQIIAPQMYQCSQKYQRLFKTIQKLNLLKESLVFTEEWLISDSLNQLENILNTGLLRMTWCSLSIDKYCLSLEKEILNVTSKANQAKKTLHMLLKKTNSIQKFQLDFSIEPVLIEDIQNTFKLVCKAVSEKVILAQTEISSILQNIPKVFLKKPTDPIYAQLCVDSERKYFNGCEKLLELVIGKTAKYLKVDLKIKTSLMIAHKKGISSNPSSSHIYKIISAFPAMLLGLFEHVPRWKHGTCQPVKADQVALFNIKEGLMNSPLYNKCLTKYTKNCQEMSKIITVHLDDLGLFQILWQSDLDGLKLLNIKNEDKSVFYANLINTFDNCVVDILHHIEINRCEYLHCDLNGFKLNLESFKLNKFKEFGENLLSSSLITIKDEFLKMESYGDVVFGSDEILQDFDNFFKLNLILSAQTVLKQYIYHYNNTISLCHPLFNCSSHLNHLKDYQITLTTKMNKNKEYLPVLHLFQLLVDKLNKEYIKVISFGDLLFSKYSNLLISCPSCAQASKIYSQFNKEFIPIYEKSLHFIEIGSKSNLTLIQKWTMTSCPLFPNDQIELFLNAFATLDSTIIPLLYHQVTVEVIEDSKSLQIECELLFKIYDYKFLQLAIQQLGSFTKYLILLQSIAIHNLESRHLQKLSKLIKSDISLLTFESALNTNYDLLSDCIQEQVDWFKMENKLSDQYLNLLKQENGLMIQKQSTLLFKQKLMNTQEIKLLNEKIMMELSLLLSLDQSEFIRMEIISSNEEIALVDDVLGSLEAIQIELESIYAISQNLLKNEENVLKINQLLLRFQTIAEGLIDYESLYLLLKTQNKELALLKKDVFLLKHLVFTELDQFRNQFSRFWILSNDELIKILSFSFNKEWFNTFKRCFNGIELFLFIKDHQNVYITGLKNTDGDILHLNVDVLLSYDDLNCFSTLLLAIQDAMRHQILLAMDHIALNNLTSLLKICMPAIAVAFRYCYSHSYYTSLLDTLLSQLQDLHLDSKTKKIILLASNARDTSSVFKLEFVDNKFYTKFLSHTLPHGLEFTCSTRQFCYTPITIKTFCNYFMDSVTHQWTYVLGLSGSGKTESIQEFADFCGYFCYEVNCGDVLGRESFKNILHGSEFMNYWVNLSEVNRLNPQVLLDMSEIVLKLNSQSKATVFVSLNPYSQSRNIIPESVKFQFHQLIIEKPPIREIALKTMTSPINGLFNSACYLDCYHTRDTYPGIFLKLLQLQSSSTVTPNLKSFVNSEKSMFMYKKDDLSISKFDSMLLFLEKFHSLVLVGSLDASFTVTIDNIYRHYSLNNIVKIQYINPNIYANIANFGQCDEFDIFKSGIITTCLEEGCSYKGIYILVLDAELYSEWSENLNSVLDDNRSFFYPDGKKLDIKSNVKIIFCTYSLKMVSPSVTRRSTVVFVDEINAQDEFWHGTFEKLKLDGKLINTITLACVVNFYNKVHKQIVLSMPNMDYYLKLYAFWTFTLFPTYEAFGTYFMDTSLCQVFPLFEYKYDYHLIYDPDAIIVDDTSSTLKIVPSTDFNALFHFIKQYLISTSKETWQTQKMQGYSLLLLDLDHSEHISCYSFLRYFYSYSSVWTDNDNEWVNKKVSKLKIKATTSQLNHSDPEFQRLIRNGMFLKLQQLQTTFSAIYYYGNGILPITMSQFVSFESYLHDNSASSILIDVAKENQALSHNKALIHQLLTRLRYPIQKSPIESLVLHGRSMADLKCIQMSSVKYINCIQLDLSLSSYFSFIEPYQLDFSITAITTTLSTLINNSQEAVNKYSNNLNHLVKLFNLICLDSDELAKSKSKKLQRLKVLIQDALSAIKTRQIGINQSQEQAFKESQNLSLLRQDMSKKTKDIDDKKAIASLKEQEINQSKLLIEQQKQILDLGLQQSYPILESAKKALSNISASDITELRSFSKPPLDVQKVVECICILLKKDDLTWKGAKSMMSNTEFRNNLLTLDCDTLSNHQIHHIEKIVKNSELSTDKMKKTSSAGYALLDYVFNILEYHAIVTEMKPKMNLLKEFDTQLNTLIKEKDRVLEEIQLLEQEISELQDQLRVLETNLRIVDKNIVIWSSLQGKFDLILTRLNSEYKRNEVELVEMEKQQKEDKKNNFNKLMMLLDYSEKTIAIDHSMALLFFISEGLQTIQDAFKFLMLTTINYSIIIEDKQYKCMQVLSKIDNIFIVAVNDKNLMQKIKFGIENHKKVIIKTPLASLVPIECFQYQLMVYCSKADVEIQNYAIVSFDAKEVISKVNEDWIINYKELKTTCTNFEDCSTQLMNSITSITQTKDGEHVDELLNILVLYDSLHSTIKDKTSQLFKEWKQNCDFNRYVTTVANLPQMYQLSSHLYTCDTLNNDVDIDLKSITYYSLLPQDQLNFGLFDKLVDIYKVAQYLSKYIVFVFSQGDSTYQLLKNNINSINCTRSSIKDLANDATTTTATIYYNISSLSQAELLEVYFYLQTTTKSIIIDLPIQELNSSCFLLFECLKVGYKLSSLVPIELDQVIDKNNQLVLHGNYDKHFFILFHSIICFLIEKKLIHLYPQYWIDNLISVVDSCQLDLQSSLEIFYIPNMRHLNEKLYCRHLINYITTCKDVSSTIIFEESDLFEFTTHFDRLHEKLMPLPEFNKLQLLEELTLDQQVYWSTNSIINIHFLSIPSNLVYFFDQDLYYIDGIPVLHLQSESFEESIKIYGLQFVNGYLTSEGLVYAQSKLAQFGYIGKSQSYDYLVPLFKDNVLYLYFSCTVRDPLLHLKIVRMDIE